MIELICLTVNALLVRKRQISNNAIYRDKQEKGRNNFTHRDR